MLRRRSHRVARYLGLATVLVGCAGGCTPETRYQVLCVFFEGVPRPGESAEQPPTTRRASMFATETGYQLPAPKGSIHPPVRERLCHECHNMPDPRRKKAGGGFAAVFDINAPLLRMEPKQLCFKCHEKILQLKRVHGPVANGLCLDCHNPHGSQHPKLLLRKPNEELCGKCHSRGNFTPASDHAGGMPGECTDCHGPHGGEAEFFLREGPALEAWLSGEKGDGAGEQVFPSRGRESAGHE